MSVKCYTTCPYEYRLTHDISLENISSVDEDSTISDSKYNTVEYLNSRNNTITESFNKDGKMARTLLKSPYILDSCNLAAELEKMGAASSNSAAKRKITEDMLEEEGFGLESRGDGNCSDMTNSLSASETSQSLTDCVTDNNNGSVDIPPSLNDTAELIAPSELDSTTETVTHHLIPPQQPCADSSCEGCVDGVKSDSTVLSKTDTTCPQCKHELTFAVEQSTDQGDQTTHATGLQTCSTGPHDQSVQCDSEEEGSRSRQGLFNGLKAQILDRISKDVVRLDLRQHYNDRSTWNNDEDDVFVKQDYINHKQHADKDKKGCKKVKKPRRPRKLPDIPVSAAPPQRNASPAPSNTSVASSERSLAEELYAADPSGYVQHFQPYNIHLSPEEESSSVQMEQTEEVQPNVVPVYTPQNVVPPQETSSDETKNKRDSGYHEVEFFENPEEYFEDEPNVIDKLLSHDMKLQFNTTSRVIRPLLRTNNTFIHEDSSPEKPPKPKRSPSKLSSKSSPKKSSRDSPPTSSSLENAYGAEHCNSYAGDVELLDATHRGCHKFVPRHDDELFIEIGDPVHVLLEYEDLWCDAINLRTAKKGIFPSAYATDLSIFEDDVAGGMKPMNFKLRFLGSVEVNYHKGNDVICQAIHKVAASRRMTLNTSPAPVVTLEVNEYGIKMTEKPKPEETAEQLAKESVRERLQRILQKVKSGETNNHFFSLKNVSFCAYHPRNEKYFAFITKHPLEMRFACHVFLADSSTKRVAEGIGTAFKKFYQQYMALAHPTEDIYLE